jgi:ATP-dependent DNA helicase RecQ
VLLYSSADESRWCSLVDKSAAESAADVSPEVVAAQKALIKQMAALARGAVCRHKALSEHFGQAYAPPSPMPPAGAGCGACDVCLQELDEIDGALVIAQKIVSCVARLRGPGGQGAYGAAYVAAVLRGSASAKVVERGHHGLSTFGILREMPRDVLGSCIAQLVDAGVLEREDGEFPVVRLGPKAGGVLKGTAGVRLLRQKSAAEEAATGGETRRAGRGAVEELSASERGLFERLRVVRREVAEGMGVPPYVVFGDAALTEMARVRPGSVGAFSAVRGVGRAKLEKFGERFVGEIAAYCGEHGLGLDAAEGARPRPGLVEERAGAARVTAGSREAGAMFARGSSVEDVCAAMGRAPSTVRGYLEDFVREVKPASIGAWVDAGTYARVLAAAEETGSGGAGARLKPIFEQLGGEVGYDAIRLVLTHARVVGPGQ